MGVENRNGVHEAGRARIHSSERRVQNKSGEELDGDVTGRIRHMLHGPHSSADNNVHVHGHERDAAAG